MKKIVTLVFTAFLVGMSITASAQIEMLQFKDVNHFSSDSVRYKLYPTFNMWTFLKLDTRTGLITQVQYSINGDEFECILGFPGQSLNSTNSQNGRYELYPTTNSWTFLLLDQIEGKVYHVQWSQKTTNRGVYEIQFSPLN